MKKFLSAMIVALVVAVSAQCSAMNSVSVTELNRILGNWYDAKGNVVLTISNDYSINGCKVLALYLNNDYKPIFAYQSSAVYTCRINDGHGIKEIHLDYHSMPTIYQSTPDYHEMIVLNGKTALRRTKEPRYFESVGGIYLGMHKDDVVKLYGQPSSVNNNMGHITWKYRGFDVQFAADVVDCITIYKNNDRRFDWSGLSANNAKDDFKRKYSGREGQTSRRLIIGYGESLSFRQDCIIFDTGF